MSFLRNGVSWRLALGAAIVLLALAGCQPAQPAAEPTEAGEPAVEQAYPGMQESYPGPAQPAAEGAYPAPEGGGTFPGKVPARPNGSRVTAELISAQPDEAQPGYTRLRVKLLSSAALEGMDSVTDNLVGQEMDLLIDAAQLPDLQAGDTFEAEISFLGDEHGSGYYILKLLKMGN